MSKKVTFIGLGVMGYPMAGYISKAGHDVTVYNRTTAKAEKWVGEYGGKHASTPKEAAKDSDFVFTCVGNDNDLKEVTFGDNGIFKQLKKVLFILITQLLLQQLLEKFMSKLRKESLVFLMHQFQVEQ